MVARRAPSTRRCSVDGNPIPAQAGGGFCYLDGAHRHHYSPLPAPLYQSVASAAVFVGDPTPFGYEGQRFTFYGQHPIAASDSLWCFLDGPHFHYFEAPRSALFRFVDAVAFYVGAAPRAEGRKGVESASRVAAVYAPWVTLRPRVSVTPPPEWHGRRWASAAVLPVAAAVPAPAATPPAAARSSLAHVQTRLRAQGLHPERGQ